jgi:hypothetical protein
MGSFLGWVQESEENRSKTTGSNIRSLPQTSFYKVWDISWGAVLAEWKSVRKINKNKNISGSLSGQCKFFKSLIYKLESHIGSTGECEKKDAEQINPRFALWSV